MERAMKQTIRIDLPDAQTMRAHAATFTPPRVAQVLSFFSSNTGRRGSGSLQAREKAQRVKGNASKTI
jgi:hypothetical protein